jgi:predicted nucleotidyltransferase
MNIILAGVVGSKAYGLDNADSDTDTLGIYATPTQDLLGLRRPRQTITTTSPDTTYHEAAKALQLMLSSNPTAMEVLWLEKYDVMTPLGAELVELRSAFLSREGVRRAYLGYAGDQLKKLQQLKKFGAFGNPRRAEKHARHLVRLLTQGTELHRTGELPIRLEHPEEVLLLGLGIFDDPTAGDELLQQAKDIFNEPGALPEQTDSAAAEAWLHRVRDHYYERWSA